MASKNKIPVSPIQIPSGEISTISIGGHDTRKLFLKSDKKNNYLIVYGHHSNIERIYSLALFLNRYGSVTAVDLPGHAGIPAKWKNPKFGNYADYLKECINHLYKDDDRVNIVTMSYGFILVTTLLQMYPELQPKIARVISLGSFTSDKQLNFSWLLKNIYRITSWVLSRSMVVFLVETMILKNKWCLRWIITSSLRRSPKTKGVDRIQFNKIVDMEMNLWSGSDFETHYKTTLKMLKFSLPEEKIASSLINLYSKSDQYIIPEKSINAINRIYQDAIHLPVDLKSHAPSLVADVKEIEDMMPRELTGLL